MKSNVYKLSIFEYTNKTVSKLYRIFINTYFFLMISSDYDKYKRAFWVENILYSKLII